MLLVITMRSGKRNRTKYFSYFRVSSLKAGEPQTYQYYFKMAHSGLLVLYFHLFYLNVQLINKFGRCWVSNHVSLMSKVTALPTEPPPLPNYSIFNLCTWTPHLPWFIKINFLQQPKLSQFPTLSAYNMSLLRSNFLRRLWTPTTASCWSRRTRRTSGSGRARPETRRRWPKESLSTPTRTPPSSTRASASTWTWRYYKNILCASEKVSYC